MKQRAFALRKRAVSLNYTFSQKMSLLKKGLLCFVLLISFLNCSRKSEVLTTDPSARLTFSTSVVFYDTVFADLKYPTKWIQVYNYNSGALSLDQVSLAGGSSSPFKITVNGQAGPVVSGLELFGGDSMTIIVDLFFDTNSQTLPYLIQDSILFRFNGQVQTILLKAVGRNALLIAAGNLTCGQVWDSTKTVILLGQTVVPPGCTLTIQKSTQILGSSGSSLDVKGTLVVAGQKNSPVFFGGLVSGKSPGQWKGIRFYQGSSSNQLSWFTLENAVTGISFNSTTSSPLVDLKMDHAIFNDFTQSALALSYITLNAYNCLFDAAAGSITQFSKQGNYTFRNCTWAGYSYDYFRQGPSIQIDSITGTLSFTLNDCIVWGDQLTEITYDPAATVLVDTSLIKSNLTIPGQGNILNQDPNFVSSFNRDFQLASPSPAINAGTPSFVVDDLNGTPRDSKPDLGCYEYVP